MKAKLFKQASSPATPTPVWNSYVSEALAKQAATRPPPTPPKQLETPPTLPKMPKLYRTRKRLKKYGPGGGR